MDMDELLGLNDGDFEGVGFAESGSDSDVGEPGKQRASKDKRLSTGSMDTSNGQSVENNSSTAAAATALTSRTQGRVDSDSDANGIVVKPSSAAADSDSKEVDAERGSPLPEHTRESDKALSLLRRVERCCLESKSGEVEAVVASLSSYMDGTGTHGSKSDDEAGIAVECFGALSSGKKAEGAGLVVDAALGACRAALQLCRGEYEELIRETALFSSFSSPPAERSGDCVDGAGGDVVKTCVRAFVTHTQGVNSGDVNVADDANTAAAIWRAAEAMWAGAAALSLFLQENYSGPELGTERKGKLDAWFGQIIQGSGQNGAETSGAIAPSGASAGIVATRGEGQELANMALACDGELPYPQSGLAGALFLGRTILKTLVDVSPDAVGGSAKGQKEEDATFLKAAGSLSSVSWWSARACVAHARLLLSPGRSETLWIEAVSLFGRAVQSFGGGVGQEERDEGKDREGAEGKQGRRDNVRRKMGGQVWLEWGLAQHHFQDPSKGKESFARAKVTSGLTTALTGALGKRTKHQQSQVAQLVLIAESYSPVVEESVPESGETSTTSPPLPPPKKGGCSNVDKESKAHDDVVALSGPELGMTTTVGQGQEKAAARRTRHAEDGELLEDISFVESDLENPGKLQDVDLAIILGLCLDVKNSNPRDGLTNEQMSPYISRVLRQPGCNWMIYSTALLQRAWVEFERSHARDRAALQLQALLDQHTTKLTYTQSTAETVEDSAPAEDRLRYLSCLSFPPRWELRRDLAQRYAGMGVLGSAAAEFVDLEMWEEAVECYRQMQQIHKAESIARQRLKEKETPPMLVALGELTQDPELWERAWELSGGRYARAKLSLGRMRFSEGKYKEACGHYEQALAVKPLLPSAWFSLGVARMRLGQWDESLRAFSTVAQQEPEEGEAWGNMGAVHMHQGNWASATAAFTEGLKQMPSNWRMWENQAEALLRLGRWSLATYACHRMLDLSDKSKRGVDAEYLALLVEGALKQEPMEKPPGQEPLVDTATPASSPPSDVAAASTAKGGVAAGDRGGDLAGRPLCKQVSELLGRVVASSTARGDARMWEVYARFNEGAGRDRSRVLDCVSKQCRALQRAGWEKDAAAVNRVASASDKLVQLYLEDGTRQSAYQAKMHLATAARKVKAADVCAGCPGHERIFVLLHNVEGVLAELKSREATVTTAA